MKRGLSLVLVLAFMMELLSLSACGNKTDVDEGDAVTRGEWITMLAETFGLDSYVEENPYYSDVTYNSSLFPYVQSSAEWKVLSIFSDEKLNVDEKITKEEVGSTAAIAAGCDVSDDQFNSSGEFDSSVSVKFAVQNGILEDDKNLSDNITREECENALSAAKNAYLNSSFEEKSIVVADEGIVDLTGLDAKFISLDEDQMIFPGSTSNSSNVGNNKVGTADVIQNDDGNLRARIDTGSGVVEVGVGEVFVTAPTDENPTGVAYKVASIEEIDGDVVITTEEPTLYDLYEELSVEMTVAADASDIIWDAGVLGSQNGASGISSNDGDTFYIDMLSSSGSSALAPTYLDSKSYKSGGNSYNFTIGQGEFKKTWSNSSVIGSSAGAQALENSNFIYDGTPSIDDFNGSTESWTKDLEIDNSFSGGYKITGSLSINAVTVTTSVEYLRSKRLEIPYGIDSASVQVNSDISSSLKLEGYLGNKLHIATVPIPIAATGLSVAVDLYLYVDFTGSLSVEASLGSSAKVEYANGKIKHTASSEANSSVNAAIEVDFGAELAATLEALGIVKIIDVGVKAGGVLTASASISGSCKASEEDGVAKLTYQESLSIKADLYVPTVNLYVGGSKTLISSLGLNGSWDIITKDKGAAHFSLADYEWVFWEETVLTDENGTVVDSESTSAGEEDGVGATNEERLDLTTYVLTLSGEAKQLELDLEVGEIAPDVIWSSEDSSIASVDSNGLVSPVGTGYTVITVCLASDSSVFVRCAVYVEELGEENWEFLPADLAYRVC